MKLYSYQVVTSIGNFERIGVEYEGRIIDLNLACASYFIERNESDPYGLAQFHIPPSMVKFFERGDESKKLAAKSIEYIKDTLVKKKTIVGPNKEQIIYDFSEIKLMAPVPRPNIIRDCMVFLEHFKENWKREGG